MSFIPVVLCGGSGARLWPLSRGDFPKPFVVLPGRARSLLDDTYARLAGGRVTPQAIITVAAADQAFLCAQSVKAHAPGIPHTVISEPLRRNTAPAIAAAAAIAAKKFGDDATLAVMPADHLIDNIESFWTAMTTALSDAGAVTLLGIPPTYPATGYGYIECVECGGAKDTPVRAVRRFVEKPDAARAQEFLQQENYFWNSGMFCFKAKTGLAAIRRHAPDIAALLPPLLSAVNPQDDHIVLPHDLYAAFPDISFDYAVMEKTEKANVVPAADLGWSDIGAWHALAQTLPPDADGNRGNRGASDHLLSDCRDTLVVGQERVIAAVGLRDVSIVDTPDALLVMSGNQSEAVRKIYNMLAEKNSAAALSAPTVAKPWGTYTVLSEGDGYKVKRIDVLPGAALSLQSHQHRSEHWTTVLGELTVTINDETFAMPTDRSCFIPPQAKHRLANHGDAAAAIIEVQIGGYLGEDDIVRYDDKYDRI